MKIVHLIRHGEPVSGWGEPGGSPDPGLNAVGAAQAQAAAERLIAMGGPERATRVATSPLVRCRETAAPFAARLRVSPLVEPGVAEIPTPADLAPGERAPWLRKAMAGDWRDIEGLDGEAWRREVVEAVLGLEGGAVFTHFVAINAAVTAAQGSSAVLAFRPAPGSITTLRLDGTQLAVVRLGEALPEQGRVL